MYWEEEILWQKHSLPPRRRIFVSPFSLARSLPRSFLSVPLYFSLVKHMKTNYVWLIVIMLLVFFQFCRNIWSRLKQKELHSTKTDYLSWQVIYTCHLSGRLTHSGENHFSVLFIGLLTELVYNMCFDQAFHSFILKNPWKILKLNIFASFRIFHIPKCFIYG